MSGKLGSVDLASQAMTMVYDAPIGKVATVNVRIANRNAIPIKISVAVSTGLVPANADYISYQQEVPENGIYEDTALVMSGGEKVLVWASSSNVSVRVHGMEG